MTTTAVLLLLLGLALGLALGLVVGLALGVPRGRLRGLDDARRAALAERREAPDPAAEQARLQESLERLHDHLRDLDHARVAMQSRLHQQVDDVRTSTDGLRRETASLVGALRRPQVRGRWGELHLRRAVELAGMVEHCDFTEQVRLAEGAQRPDLVVHLAGGRSVVVDAKAPLEAFLDAAAVEGEGPEAAEVREQHLARLARHVRTHIDHLGSKAYWQALPETPEFVVLFLPTESVWAAALEADAGLVEHAATRQVVLASPGNLIALLRTVAHGWRHQALTEQAAQVHALGRELHDRLGRFARHLDQVGRSLNAAVGHYNSAVGSWDARVMVQTRRLADLAAAPEPAPSPRTIDLQAVPPRRADDDEPGLAS